jgi:hypothetical protein
MAIDPATGEEEEDLSTIEWGAGLTRLVVSQFPNIILVCLGWSCIALPCYIITGWGEKYLSHGADVVFPIVLTGLFVVLSILMYWRLRAPIAKRRQKAAQVNPSYSGGQPILINGAGGLSEQDLDMFPDHDNIDTSPSSVMGYRVHPEPGVQRNLELAALTCCTLAWICFGWTVGLTTFCAYDKRDGIATIGQSEPLMQDPITQTPAHVYWEECYQISRALTGTGDVTSATQPITCIPACIPSPPAPSLPLRSFLIGLSHHVAGSEASPYAPAAALL